MTRTDHTAAERTYAVVHTEPPTWHELEAGDTIATRHPITLSTDRDEALALMPEGWSPEEPGGEEP